MGWSFDIADLGHDEGYLARILSDGSRVTSYGHGIPDVCIGVEVQCDCGWAGKRWDAPEEGWAGYDCVDDRDDEAGELWVAHVYEAVPLLRLQHAAQALAEAKEDVENAVYAAAHNGKSWSEIGEVLGISKQAAWERYHL